MSYSQQNNRWKLHPKKVGEGLGEGISASASVSLPLPSWILGEEGQWSTLLENSLFGLQNSQVLGKKGSSEFYGTCHSLL
jgi:hypothetical protein